MTLQHILAAMYADRKDLDPVGRLILIYLAEHAGQEGVAWPSRSAIAGWANVSVDTVDRRVADLLGMGLIVEASPDETPAAWHQWRADRRPKAYRLTGPQTAAPYKNGAAEPAPRGRNTPGHGAAAVRHETRTETEGNRAGAREVLDDGRPSAQSRNPAYTPLDTQQLYRARNAAAGVDHHARAQAARSALHG